MAYAAMRMGVFLSALILFYAIESLWPARSWESPRWKRLAVHASLGASNTLVLRLSVAAPLALWVNAVWDRHGGVAGWLGLKGPTELLVSCVAFDFFDYWWHRANHQSSFLWRFHRVHHLDTHVDVTTSLRFHLGEFLLSALAKAIWVWVWGPSLWAFVLGEMEVTAASQFHHSNIDLPRAVERAVGPAVMTPRVHASHHTMTQRTRDANFSTVLSVWDRLFGTFQEPEDRDLRHLGLNEGRGDYLSIWAMLKAPFV